MKTYIASLMNALILISFGLWGYFVSATPSFTALIPVVFGLALLAINPGIKRENKTIAHIAVILTFLVMLGLFMPLRGAILRDDMSAVLRVLVMLLASITALVYFVRSFLAARWKR
jgi:hypothetical protein